MDDRYTLVVIDMQSPYLNRLSQETRQRLETDLVSLIKDTKSLDNGIIIAEYDVKNSGSTVPVIMGEVKDYHRMLCFEHSHKSLGPEVLAIIKQQFFYLNRILLTGLFEHGSIKETAEDIYRSSRFRTEPEIVCVAADVR